MITKMIILTRVLLNRPASIATNLYRSIEIEINYFVAVRLHRNANPKTDQHAVPEDARLPSYGPELYRLSSHLVSVYFKLKSTLVTMVSAER